MLRSIPDRIAKRQRPGSGADTRQFLLSPASPRGISPPALCMCHGRLWLLRPPFLPSGEEKRVHSGGGFGSCGRFPRLHRGTALALSGSARRCHRQEEAEAAVLPRPACRLPAAAAASRKELWPPPPSWCPGQEPEPRLGGSEPPSLTFPSCPLPPPNRCHRAAALLAAALGRR